VSLGSDSFYLPVSNYEELKIVCTNCNFITGHEFGTDCKKHMSSIFGRMGIKKRRKQEREREGGGIQKEEL